MLARAADTGGEYAAVEVYVRATAPGFLEKAPGSLPLHSHPDRDEEVLVRQGVVAYTLMPIPRFKKEGVLRAGERLLIPKGEFFGSV